MILARNYIQTGFSADDAEKLDTVIRPLFDKHERITIDFEGIKIFTTLFFNTALAKYVMDIGPVEYEKLFELKNLSDVGEVTYKHSLDNAKSYYEMTEEQRKKQDEILADPE